MLDGLQKVVGEVLDKSEYLTDFVRESVPGSEGWKLEVRQSFREPGYATWEAWEQGDHETSLRLLEENADSIAEQVQTPPNPFRRVRIVQEPWTSYLEWELHALRVRERAGEQIAVVDATPELLALPELVVINATVVYEVLYTDAGELSGAIKATGEDAVRKASAIEELFERGAPLSSYMAAVAI